MANAFRVEVSATGLYCFDIILEYLCVSSHVFRVIVAPVVVGSISIERSELFNILDSSRR